MKIKIISMAVATLCFSQLALSQVKTIDFYSTNGTNRYNVEGVIKDFNFSIENNSVLLPDANESAYVKVNGHFPYYTRFSNDSLNTYQVIDSNKGKNISFNDSSGEMKTGEILGLTGDLVSIKSGDSVLFVKITDVKVPLNFYSLANKGLMIFFPNVVKDTDKIFVSQTENQLSYSNSYDALISENNIEVTQFLNINNSSQKTFDKVKLNFFLSETNINDRVNPRMPQLASAPMRMEKTMMDIGIDVPSFTADSVQNLKFISITNPTTIYPNFNKIKYTQNTYPLKEYTKITLDKKFNIVFYDDFISLSDEKKKEKIDDVISNYKKSLFDLNFSNYIEFQPKKDEIFPAGKISVYQKGNSGEKLIISNQMSYTENSPVVLLKNTNADLKVIDMNFEKINPKKLDVKVTGNRTQFNIEIQSFDIINNGSIAYSLKVLDKFYQIKPGQKITISL